MTDFFCIYLKLCIRFMLIDADSRETDKSGAFSPKNVIDVGYITFRFS